MALDGIVISNIVAELNSTILNSKISKIAEPEADELLLTLKPSHCPYILHGFKKAYSKRTHHKDLPAGHGAYHKL